MGNEFLRLFFPHFFCCTRKEEFYGSRAVLLLKTLLEKCVPNKDINRRKFIKLISCLIEQTMRFNLKKSLSKSDEYNWRNENLKYLV